MAEPLALIAHPDKYLVEKALRYVEVDVDELPGIFSIEEALTRRQRPVWFRQHFQVLHHSKRRSLGEVERGGVLILRGDLQNAGSRAPLHRTSGHDREG